jgi:hypothetical protein
MDSWAQVESPATRAPHDPFASVGCAGGIAPALVAETMSARAAAAAVGSRRGEMIDFVMVRFLR